jgi:ppGpp synthetase/RelA/SpoT-type nucleotidyltranferase
MMPADIEQEYASQLPTWKKLKDEAVFTLEQAIASASLKIHQIESRVKELDSFVSKAYASSYADPLNHIKDIVGVRIITLFKSNLDLIDEIIHREFKVISKDDKTDDDKSAFGYQSIHYICMIRPDCSGPRYRDISGHSFEVQARTLCMHAWAAVSHHLDYKGDWDVPKELKKSLQALSGLFHVADSQFEQFFLTREKYKRKTARIGLVGHKDLNLETLYEYSRKKFPDKKPASKDDISKIVQEFLRVGIANIDKVNELVDLATLSVLEIEEKGNFKFAAPGALRVSIGLASQDYRNLKYGGRTLEQAKELFSKA